MLPRRRLLAGLAAAIATPAAAQPPAPIRFAEAIALSAATGGRALIVQRHGVRLHESYAAGVRLEQPFALGEATSALLVLLAAALARDRLMTFDEPLAMTLGHWGADPIGRLATLRHVLEQSSGLPAETGAARREALSARPTTPPGQAFAHTGANAALFAEVAARKLAAANRGDPATYLNERVLTRIGASATFASDRDGALDFHAGGAVTARGLAEIGDLFRRSGVWRARQLVSAFVTKPALQASYVSARYGMGFWIAGVDRRPGGQQGLVSDLWTAPEAQIPKDVAMAAGAQGQRLFVIPSRQLVVVRIGGASAPGWSDAAFLSGVLRDL